MQTELASSTACGIVRNCLGQGSLDLSRSRTPVHRLYLSLSKGSRESFEGRRDFCSMPEGTDYLAHHAIAHSSARTPAWTASINGLPFWPETCQYQVGQGSLQAFSGLPGPFCFPVIAFAWETRLRRGRSWTGHWCSRSIYRSPIFWG